MHTDGDGILHLDRHQDYHLDAVEYETTSSVSEGENGVVIVEFHRFFDTCDNDDYLIDVRWRTNVLKGISDLNALLILIVYDPTLFFSS